MVPVQVQMPENKEAGGINLSSNPKTKQPGTPLFKRWMEGMWAAQLRQMEQITLSLNET